MNILVPVDELPRQVSIQRWDDSGDPNETSTSYVAITKRDPWDERWDGWLHGVTNGEETALLNGRYWFGSKRTHSNGKFWMLEPDDTTIPVASYIGRQGKDQMVVMHLGGSVFGMPVTDPGNILGLTLSSWRSEDVTLVQSSGGVLQGFHAAGNGSQQSPLRRSVQEQRNGTDSSVGQAIRAITEIKSWLNLTLDEAVSLCNLSVRTTQYWENGTTKTVRPRTVRKLFEAHGVVQMLVEKWGREKARQWLNMPSRTGRGRLEVLSDNEGAQILLREAGADLFEVAPRPERPILEPEPEVDLDVFEDRTQSKGSQVKVRRPRKVSQFGH